MKRFKWIKLGLMIVAMGLSPSVKAEDLVGDSGEVPELPEVSPTPEPTPLPAVTAPNPLLTQRAEEIAKRAMVVLKEEEGVINLSLTKDGHSLANKTQILFFRRKGARMEIIADGVVTGDQKNAKGGAEVVVELNRDTIVKYPVKGDFAIPMSDPNGNAEGDKKDEYNYLVPEDPNAKVDNPLPGYLEFGMGVMQGTLNSTSSTDADSSKKTSNYRFKIMHFAYYSDFIPIGVEYDSHSGNFPTATYYLKTVSSSESVSRLAFVYRFHPFLGKKLYFQAKFATLSDAFKTDNPDENVLNTSISGIGAGVKASYDFVSAIWKPKGKFGFAFQNVYGEFMFYPMVTAKDTGVSRGTTSSGSTAMQYRVGATMLLYMGFIPILKRFVIEPSYGLRSYNLSFQGPTVKEVNPIPENGTGKYSEGDIRVFVGVRFEDPIKMLMGDDDKKKKDKKWNAASP